MTIRLDLRQTNTVAPGPIYKVKNEIVYALGIPSEVFVFETETQEFSNVASVWEVMNLPVGYAAAFAVGAERYRTDVAEVGYSSVDTAVAFAAHVQSRVDGLLNTFETYTDGFEGSNTYSYTAG